MSMLASDDGNPAFVGAHNPDAALSVRFHSKAVQNNWETSKQGRPIFQDIDYIEIFTPGNTLNIIDTPVREEHKHRFPIQWAAYQNAHSGDQRETGTPLSQWPYLTSAQAEELKGIKFFTVEAIAHASDEQIQHIGMIGGMSPHALRDRATAYLNAAAGSASAEHAAAEKSALQAQLKALQDQISALMGGNPVVATVEQSVTETISAKPKKVLSPEHLAKLAAGRAAKKAAKG